MEHCLWCGNEFTELSGGAIGCPVHGIVWSQEATSRAAEERMRREQDRRFLSFDRHIPLPDLLRQLSELLWDDGRLDESSYFAALAKAAHKLPTILLESHPAAILAQALGYEEPPAVSCESCGSLIEDDEPAYCQDCQEG
jgi:hypothetical protein